VIGFSLWQQILTVFSYLELSFATKLAGGDTLGRSVPGYVGSDFRGINGGSRPVEQHNKVTSFAQRKCVIF
jgi:hypothetical protein